MVPCSNCMDAGMQELSQSGINVYAFMCYQRKVLSNCAKKNNWKTLNFAIYCKAVWDKVCAVRIARRRRSDQFFCFLASWNFSDRVCECRVVVVSGYVLRESRISITCSCECHEWPKIAKTARLLKYNRNWTEFKCCTIWMGKIIDWQATMKFPK